MENKETKVATTSQPGSLTYGQRFTEMVVREFTAAAGDVGLTAFQRRLVQNYYIAIDNAINVAEERRAMKAEKNRDPLPVRWENVNLSLLPRNIVACARIGYDPALPNHISFMIVKNKQANKYDIVMVEGYRGIELKAHKYGLDMPDDVIVELVYKNDKFLPRKKNIGNPSDSYEFEITNPFDRGEIIGGFYYHVFAGHPEKNKLVVVSKKDIDKRKPRYASVEFWGGEKDVWEDGKKVGSEHNDGWYSEMALKTIKRMAYRDITIDSQKIDDNFLALVAQEQDAVRMIRAEAAQEEANDNIGTGVTIDIPVQTAKEEPVKEEPAPVEQMTIPIDPPAEQAQTSKRKKPEF